MWGKILLPYSTAFNTHSDTRFLESTCFLADISRLKPYLFALVGSGGCYARLLQAHGFVGVIIINTQRACARGYSTQLCQSAVSHSTVDLEDGNPSTFKSSIKLEALDYLSPFSVVLFKVLRLFSRKSKLNFDCTNTACMGRTLLHSIT